MYELSGTLIKKSDSSLLNIFNITCQHFLNISFLNKIGQEGTFYLLSTFMEYFQLLTNRNHAMPGSIAVHYGTSINPLIIAPIPIFQVSHHALSDPINGFCDPLRPRDVG